MGWIKKGKIFDIKEAEIPWAASHACVPTTYQLDQQTIRILYAPRNDQGQSIPTFFDVDAQEPSKIKYIHKEPVMALGELGTFDDGGIMPCCIVPVGNELYLYYVGWNPSGSVPYRNAVGLAISKDNGLSFQRVYPGAIVDRTIDEPFFTASPWVLRENANTWHMWYASSTGFIKVENRVEPLYIIKYASSTDGISWERKNVTCIEPSHPEEANARATVIKNEKGIYEMWFAHRGSRDFRDGSDAYSIGYATSKDAIRWERNDQKAGITYSPKGWDSTMQTYPNVMQLGEKKYLFYNGNGFGATGIGYAEWKN